MDPPDSTDVHPSSRYLLLQYISAYLNLQLLKNLLSIIGNEYWALHHKIRYCSIVSLRKRIYTYLSDREKKAGEPFLLPFDRNGMAAYLNADRSALSRELSRMKQEGILDYHKNRFRLLK